MPRASACTRRATAYVFVGGLLAGLAGAAITLAVSPGWFGDQTVNGRGWIAIGLVIFAQWSPIRAAFGALLFGAIFRLILDIQGQETILWFENPFTAGRSETFFLGMLPYLMVIFVVDPRFALRGAQAAGGAGGAWPTVRPRRARRLTASGGVTAGSGPAPRHSSSRDSMPSNSIWTKSLVSNSSCRGANGEWSSPTGPIGANSTMTRSSPWTRA